MSYLISPLDIGTDVLNMNNHIPGVNHHRALSKPLTTIKKNFIGGNFGYANGGLLGLGSDVRTVNSRISSCMPHEVTIDPLLASKCISDPLNPIKIAYESQMIL